MYKKGWILLGALILIIVSIGFFYFNGYKSQSQGQVIRIKEITTTSEPIPTPEPPVVEITELTLKEFTITEKRFDFTPETITVNQ